MVMTNKKTASQEWADTMADRAAKRAENHIDLDTGTRLYKHAIYAIMPMLENTDDETRLDFCLHVAFGDELETEAGKALKTQLYYNSSNTGFSRSIKAIVDACLEVTTDGMLVFNSNAIMRKLDPLEVEMMRSGETNIESFLARQAQGIENEARIARSVIETAKPVEYVRQENGHRVLQEAQPGLTPELVKAYASMGIDPKRAEAFYANRTGLPDNRKPDFIFYAQNTLA